MRRLVALFASSTIVVGSIAAAGPAFAAASPPVFTVVCANGNPNASFATTDATLGSVVELTSIVGDSGDRVQIRNLSNLVNPPINANYVCGGGGGVLTVTLRGVSTTINPGSSALVSLATGTMTLTLAGKTSTTVSVTVTGDSGGGESSSGTDSAPAPVVQEFGLPSSGTCDAAASEELNWAGVASGGWGVSWAQWMNGGNGGPVCTRTLFYDTTAAAWAVQS